MEHGSWILSLAFQRSGSGGVLEAVQGWDNFCRNLGVWRGSFATYDHNLQLKDERPSLLTLESIPDQSMATLTLRRWQPDHEMRQVISSHWPSGHLFLIWCIQQRPHARWPQPWCLQLNTLLSVPIVDIVWCC